MYIPLRNPARSVLAHDNPSARSQQESERKNDTLLSSLKDATIQE